MPTLMVSNGLLRTWSTMPIAVRLNPTTNVVIAITNRFKMLPLDFASPRSLPSGQQSESSLSVFLQGGANQGLAQKVA